MAVKRKRIKGLDIEQYRQRLVSYVFGYGPETETGDCGRKQLMKKVVVVEVEGRLGVVLFGDRWTTNRYAALRKVFVLFDGTDKDESVRQGRLVFVHGGPRGIYWPPGVRVGTYGTMGSIAKAMRPGGRLWRRWSGGR